MTKISKGNKNSVRYAILCHIYEHYENSLFSFTAPFIATVFFPETDLVSAKLGIYMALTAGFLMSPFGATIFSWIGDRYGPRTSMIYAIFLSIIPMMLVGLLPGYSTLGSLSPFILLVARIAQGISIGGAFFATVTFIAEVSSPARRNINMGILLSMGFVGSLLGTLLMAFFRMSCMPSYMWRFAFLLGGVFGVSLYLFRGKFQESNAWKKAEKSEARVPFFHAVVECPRNIASVFLFGGSLLIPFYIAVTWLPGYLAEALHIQDTFNLMVSSSLLLITGLGMIVFCWLATFLNLKKMLYWSAASIVLPVFLIYSGLKNHHYGLLLGAQIIIAIYTSFQGAAAFLLIQKLFPVKYKYSGFAIPFALGKSIFTMSVPMVAELILKKTGSAHNITYLLIFSSLLILLGTVMAHPFQENKK